jgi:hypothetical protein
MPELVAKQRATASAGPELESGVTAEAEPEPETGQLAAHSCCICLELLCRPTRLACCAHVFCELCIRRTVLAQAARKQALGCPLCRRHIKPDLLARDVVLERWLERAFPEQTDARQVPCMWGLPASIQAPIDRYCFIDRTEGSQIAAKNAG